jgi:hypothetical protein
MVDPRKLLQARKAFILEKATKEAAEIDRDLQEMQRLSEKYGIEFAERGESAGAVLSSADGLSSSPEPGKKIRDANSPYHRAKVIAEQTVEAQRGPVQMNTIWDRVVEAGIVIPGKNPKSKFSAYLGQRSRLGYVRDRGWWFAGVALPKAGHPLQENGSAARY